MKFTFALFFAFFITKGTAFDLSCSKYDFEEKVLEKLVRLEFDVNQYKAHLEEIKSGIGQRLKKITFTAIEQELSTLEQRITDKLQTKQDAIRPVVFKARLSYSTSISYGQTIKYPVVMLNVGDGYNSSSGIFTAPVNGTYMFDIVVCPSDDKHLNVGIVINGETNTDLTLYSDYGNACFSANAVGVLETGQEAKVTVEGNTRSGMSLHQGSYRWNTFSGVLVHA